MQAVKAQLERRGFAMNPDEAQAVQLVGGEQLLIPFGQDAHLFWTRTTGQTAAVGLIRQGNKTRNVGADGQERVVRVLSAQKAEKLLRKLRERSKFQEFEGKLAQKGKRIGKVRVLFDETNRIAILGIAAEGNEEKIAHQVRIKVKANKEDEPEEGAEPAIQATACGQATGEAVPLGARMQPLLLDPGEGATTTTGSYDITEGRDYDMNICVSQWGYVYDCRKTTPTLQVTTSSLLLPVAIIPDPVQASFTVWNYGGGTLRGTVTVSAPFSIVSGGSFSLAPGQPQEVVIRFTPTTSGVFSQSATITSNGGNTAVSLTARALTLEEYMDLLVTTHNAALQQGIRERAIYLQDSSRGLALYGFPQLSRSQLQGLWENFDGLATGTSLSLPPQVAQRLEILQGISDEQWRQWILSLVEAERVGRFEEEYNRLLPVGLSTYLQGYQRLTNSNADQAKAQLHDFVRRLAATGANNLDSALAALLTLDQISNMVRALSWKIVRINFGADEETAQELVDQFVRAYEFARLSYVGPGEQAQYDLDIFKILDFLANNPNRPGNVGSFNAWLGLLNILEGLAGYGQPFQLPDGTILPGTPRTTEERKALIRVAAQAIENGWLLMGIQYVFSLDIRYGPHYFFPLFLKNSTYRLRDGRMVSAVFGIGFFQVGPGFDPNRVLEWVAQAIQGFNIMAPDHLYFRMIGAVMVGQASIGQICGMIDALRNAYGNWDGAIFVVWVDANGRVWFVCIGRGCDLLSPTQQQQNACMLAGRSPDCGAERYYSGGSTPGSSSSPVARITP